MAIGARARATTISVRRLEATGFEARTALPITSAGGELFATDDGLFFVYRSPEGARVGRINFQD